MVIKQRTIKLLTESAQLSFGAELAKGLTAGLLVSLYGDLGSGKSTLVRGVLRGAGYLGRVPSPTFTLMETYETVLPLLCHLDLYRLSDMSELELLGIRDYLDGNWTIWVEWPQRAPELAELADLDLQLDYDGDGRIVTLSARTASGAAVIEGLQ